MNIVNFQQRQKHNRDTAFETGPVLNSVCRGPQSFHMALGARTDTTGRKILSMELYVHNHKDG